MITKQEDFFLVTLIGPGCSLPFASNRMDLLKTYLQVVNLVSLALHVVGSDNLGHNIHVSVREHIRQAEAGAIVTVWWTHHS